MVDLYTDNAELHCSHLDLHMMETCLQSDLDSMATWLLSSHLCLNVDKSNCMLIKSCQGVADKALSVSIDDNVLTQGNSVWYLGVLIDLVLSWTLHVHNMVSRIRSRLASVVHYGSLPPAVLCILYSAFVMHVVWSPPTAKLNCLIERIHSKFFIKLPLTLSFLYID